MGSLINLMGYVGALQTNLDLSCNLNSVRGVCPELGILFKGNAIIGGALRSLVAVLIKLSFRGKGFCFLEP